MKKLYKINIDFIVLVMGCIYEENKHKEQGNFSCQKQSLCYTKKVTFIIYFSIYEKTYFYSFRTSTSWVM